MSKFTVHLMTPYCTWEGVDAKSKKEAILKCEIPPGFDFNEPSTFVAFKENEGEDEGEDDEQNGKRRGKQDERKLRTNDENSKEERRKRWKLIIKM